MNRVEFSTVADNWPENFGITTERADELLKASSVYLKKLLFDDPYFPADLMRDCLALAETDTEQAYQAFYAGQKLEYFDTIKKEASEVFHFVSGFGKRGGSGIRGLEDLLEAVTSRRR